MSSMGTIDRNLTFQKQHTSLDNATFTPSAVASVSPIAEGVSGLYLAVGRAASGLAARVVCA